MSGSDPGSVTTADDHRRHHDGEGEPSGDGKIDVVSCRTLSTGSGQPPSRSLAGVATDHLAGDGVDSDVVTDLVR